MISGKRTTDGKGLPTEDVTHDYFSVECKTRAKLPALIRDSYRQAVTNAPDGKVPLVVIQEKNSQDMMAVLPLQALVDLYDVAYGDAIRDAGEDAGCVGPAGEPEGSGNPIQFNTWEYPSDYTYVGS